MDDKIKTVCERTGAKAISVDLLGNTDIPPAQEEDKQKDDIAKTKKNFSGIIRIYRMIRKNPDVFFLVLFGLSLFAVGFCSAFVVMSFSVAEIKVGFLKLAALLVAIIGSGIGGVGELYSLRGLMAQSFRTSCNRVFARANKDNVDKFGMTLDK
jgi:hypothetical protein